VLAVDLLHLVGERPAQGPGTGDVEFVDKVGEIQVGRQGDQQEDVIGFSVEFTQVLLRTLSGGPRQSRETEPSINAPSPAHIAKWS
jgi:hypothetical protein